MGVRVASFIFCAALAGGCAPPAAEPATDEELSRLGVFDEPLVPVGATSPEDNRALADALDGYQAAVRIRGARDAVAPLLKLLDEHQASPWAPSVMLELGAIYRQTGHFSKALEIWQLALGATEKLDGARGRKVADAAAARLSQLEAYLGRKESLAPLLASLADRPLSGTAAELVSASRRGLDEMLTRPESSFRCGPLALQRVYRFLHPRDADARVLAAIDAVPSTDRGLPLSDVQALSKAIGLDYQVAFRSPGAPMLFPSVVHWKVGHFAAVVETQSGRFRIEDDTFGESILVAPETFDDEASGYALVPPGPLPAGWRAVSADEAARVWGRGNTGNAADGNCTNPCDQKAYTRVCGGDGHGGGMTTWDVDAMLVSLALADTPIAYQPPVGPPIRFGVYYQYRDVQQPMTGFNYFNLGNKWTTNWLSYVTDSGTSTVTLYERGGGAEVYQLDSTTSISAPGVRTLAILTRATDPTSGATTSFTRRLPDGSTEQFTQALGNKFFMTATLDPMGNKVELAYDAQLRLTTITDAIGQVTTISYESAANPLLVTKVTDPFGRAATFSYGSDGRLASVTDTIGITSQYTYGPGDFVNTLTTPYGTTSFTFGDGSLDPAQAQTRAILVTDPLGRKSRVEFVQGVWPGDQGAPAPQGMYQLDSTGAYLNWRNTYIWNPEQLRIATAAGALDYSVARNIHWDHTSDHMATSGQVESLKEPLENRVWYTYPGQMPGSFPGAIYGSGFNDLPNGIGRVLGDGSTQLTQNYFDVSGNLTRTIDPLGRELSFTYDPNGIDLLTVANTTGGRHEVLRTTAFNALHQPVKITNAAGQSVTMSYNARGQLTQQTDALGRARTLSYDASGYLTSVSDPADGANYTFTHDAVGRLASSTDPAGVTMQYAYDNADRITQISYGDGSSSSFSYKLLDVASETDRRGHTTSYQFDAARELVQSTDALGRHVSLTWCDCGGLASIADENGNQTTFVRDLQGRVVARRYADGRGESIRYDFGSSRILETTDAAGLITRYAYNADDTVAAVSHPSAGDATPTVQLRYDPVFPRVAQMIDENGTTNYFYHPTGGLGANQLAKVVSPIAGGSGTDEISYAYDVLGRIVGREVDGAVERRELDAIGRVAWVQNPLDTFTPRYADGSTRVASIASVHGPQVAMDYHAAQADGRLRTVAFTTQGGVPLAAFRLGYDADGLLTTVEETGPGDRLAPPNPDAGAGAGLIDARLASALAGAAALVALLAFAASTRREFRRGARALALSLLSAQLAIASASCSHPAMQNPPPPPPPPPPVMYGPSLTTQYSYDAADRLTAAAESGTGARHFDYAYDGATNLTSMDAHALSYSSLNQLTAPTLASYDPDGNPQKLVDAQYRWDGRHRLTAVVRGAVESDFFYDGAGRIVRIVEKNAGQVTADHAYLWCETERCAERDNLKAGSPITKRYFTQGVLVGDQPYYYVHDQLGSVRQLVDATGAIRAQYEYDPYGNQVKISGDLDSDFTWAGYFHHAASGLDLALLRAYSPSLGRWLNRDPINMEGGLNLYGYAGGNPVNTTDPTGTKDWVDKGLQVTNDVIAGFADTVSFGATKYARPWLAKHLWGTEDTTDICSGSYMFGQVLGVAHSIVTGKVAANAVKSGAASGTLLGGRVEQFGRWWYGSTTMVGKGLGKLTGRPPPNMADDGYALAMGTLWGLKIFYGQWMNMEDCKARDPRDRPNFVMRHAIDIVPIGFRAAFVASWIAANVDLGF